MKNKYHISQFGNKTRVYWIFFVNEKKSAKNPNSMTNSLASWCIFIANVKSNKIENNAILNAHDKLSFHPNELI